MPVNQMHAGEEVLYVLIPFFAGLMLFDIYKRRKLRRERLRLEQAEKPPIEEASQPSAEKGPPNQA